MRRNGAGDQELRFYHREFASITVIADTRRIPKNDYIQLIALIRSTQ